MIQYFKFICRSSFYYFILSSISLTLFAGKNTNKDGLVPSSISPRKVYIISIGYSADSQTNLNNINEKNYINFYDPTCVNDANGIITYFKDLKIRKKANLDTVIDFNFSKNRITLDSLFNAFNKIQRQIKKDDIFIFYYSGSGWGIKKDEDGIADEAYYAINPNIFSGFDFSKYSFTLRYLKSLTDRLAAINQLIIFDTGDGKIIQKDFYKNFFENNIVDAKFSQKNRIIICPEESSAESLDPVDGTKKGDLFKVISYMPDSTNILTVFNSNNSRYAEGKKKFMQSFWNAQVKCDCIATFEFLKETDFISEITSIRQNLQNEIPAIDSLRSVDSSFTKRKKIALIVATNEYDAYHHLINPVNDGRAVAELLGKKFGYEVHTLFDSGMNSILQSIDNIMNLAEENLYNQTIIYFAGHGYFDPRQNSGYLICKDSKQIRDQARPTILETRSYIDYTTLFKQLGNRLNKVLLITDVCFGGTAYNSFQSYDKMIVNPDEKVKKEMRPFKKMLASGISKVDDYIRLNSGEVSKNSPFAIALLNVLNNHISKSLDFEDLVSEIKKINLAPKPVSFAFGETSIAAEFIL